jgi:hypothetical protein
MKRILTLFVAAIAALSVSANEPIAPAPAQIETKEYDLNDFSALEISSIYNVDLSRASRHGVTVEAPDFLMPYLKVDTYNNCLHLAVSELPRDVRHRIESGRYKVRAYVSTPELNEIQMSGASKIEASGEFAPRKLFRIRMSGATSISGLAVRSSEADIECSGASKLSINGSFDRIRLQMSGSCGADIAASAKDSRIELSGAAKLSLKGNISKLNLTATGAANFRQEGQISEMMVDGSGAAKIHASDAPANKARIRLSGASGATIDVREELSLSLSGASSLRYRANDRMRIVDQNVSRASSISSFK